MSSSLPLNLSYSLGTSKQLHGLQPSEPLSALLSRIAEATGVPATSLALRAGFPPQPLATAGAATTQSLTAAGLHDCETLIVQDTRTESSGANALGHCDNQPNAKTGKHRRKINILIFIFCRALLFLTLGASPTRARHQSNQAATTEGADGLAAAAAAAIDAGEDWQATAGEQLVMAAAGREAEVGDVLRNFRQSLHTALIERQQQRLANQRLAAALANDFTMETTVGEQRLSGARPALAVTFAAGGRKKHTDTVDIIAPPLLKAIIAHIAQHPEQRENLRPFNMALFSPRVFWNLVRFNEVKLGV